MQSFETSIRKQETLKLGSKTWISSIMPSTTNSDIVICETAINFLNGMAMDPVPLTLVFRQTPDPAVWAIIENVPLSHEGIFWNVLDDGDTACLELQNGIELQGLLCESTTRLCDNSGVSGQFLVNTPVTTLKRSTKLASLQFELVNFPRFLGQQDLHVTDVTERTKNEEERVRA